ncbi:MAG: hypothetical protein QGG54_00495, partial [Gammaproteobacteria bacterium]|nr:hypothetical protein [Gammaproteobacteria bacterium]
MFLLSYLSWHAIRISYKTERKTSQFGQLAQRQSPMKVIGNLVVIFLVIVGLLALLPLVSFGFA